MQDKLIFACFIPKKVATQKLERKASNLILRLLVFLFIETI